MADACPVPGPQDPLVQALLSSTDCHVQTLVRAGYGSLFEASGPYATVLTALLTAYVGLIGYRLLLGRSQLNVSDFALSAVKIGVVVALATQWGSYQTVVYRFLFDAPRQIGDVLLHGLVSHGAAGGGDVFEGLQRAFDDLTAFAPAAPPGAVAPAAGAAAPLVAAAAPSAGALGAGGASPVGGLLSKSGYDSLLLLFSAVVLLLSTLGLLLASKIVLGLLLALGPIFIAAFLFDSTRGVFEGWLRASLGFAFAPLATTVLLGLVLTLLGPSLDAIETMRDTNTYIPGVAFAVLVLVLVFAAVAVGLVIAAGVVAGGFKLPGARAPVASGAGAPTTVIAPAVPAELGRAERVAAAATALDRRDARVPAAALAGSAAAGAAGDRRTTVASLAVGRAAPEAVVVEARLGQGPRRNASPRTARGLGARGA